MAASPASPTVCCPVSSRPSAARRDLQHPSIIQRRAMPRRLDHEAQAYEAAALNEQLPASLAVANEDDDGYSMYFFWPLSAPGILYPEEFVYEYLSGEARLFPFLSIQRCRIRTEPSI